MNNLRELTTAELKAQCPNIFEKTPIAKASNQYEVIDMEMVMEVMRSMGWFVHDTITPRSNTHGSKSMFMVRFANERFMNQENAKEVLIQSSHNLRKAFTPMMGNFTFICENGMVVGKEFVKGLNRVLHIGDAKEKVQQVLKLIEAETEKLDGAFKKMQDRRLTPAEMQELAKKAFFHFGTSKASQMSANMDLVAQTALQTAVRIEKDAKGNSKLVLLEAQEGNTLYNVYQRIQGNFTKGRILLRKHDSIQKLDTRLEQAKLTGDLKLIEQLQFQLDSAEMSKDVIPFGDMKNEFYRKLPVARNMNKLTKFNQNLFSEALALV